MKQLLQNLRNGNTTVEEVPIPTVKPGMALVRTAASLVSAGTERTLVEFASKNLAGKARSRPDLVRQVLRKARREGFLPTLSSVFNRLDQPMPLGYASAGVIIETGDGLQNFKVGDRVACAGSGYASHAEYALVPANLMAHLPPEVDFQSAAFTTLGAIALHGFRLAQPALGENVAVIGLGLLGLLAVQIARASGCHVFGVDINPRRVSLAQQVGATAVTRQDAEESALGFTNGQGFDVILICADARSDDPIELAGAIARDRGRVIAIGAVGLKIPRKTFYDKELIFQVSRSYGPGRYDSSYEQGGNDYPIGYVRWTEGRNLSAFIDLLYRQQVNVGPLISHRFPITRAAEAYELITGKLQQPFLGVLLTYPDESPTSPTRRMEIQPLNQKSVGNIRLGVLGAGNYANAMFFPNLHRVKGVDFIGVASGSGLSAKYAARKYGFHYASSDEREIIEDQGINTIAILTRHDQHARQVLAALEAGKHVFCEKPLAITIEELDSIETAVQKPGAPFLMVGFNRRFAPMSVEMKSFLQSSSEPLVMQYRVNAGFLPLNHWLHDPAVGGGRIIGEGCHFIDFLTFLVGSPPVSVRASSLPDAQRYSQDNIILTFSFINGSLGTVTYLANGNKSFPKERIEVFRGGRIAVLDDFRHLHLVADTQTAHRHSYLQQDKGHAAAWSTFINVIQSGSSAPIPYDELFGVHRATFASVRSLQVGTDIEI